MKIDVKTAGRLGAFKRNNLYGNPATEESRSKGGRVSYSNFKLNSKLANRKGFKLEKEISIPDKTPLLAEFIGIVLGDGSISEYQIRIYFNSKTDYSYARLVKEMISRLFKIDSNIAIRPKNTLELTVSSGALVRLLIDLGLKRGNKIIHQSAVPDWICNNIEYSRACLRGLIDTDGGVYFHNHVTKGIKYKNMALCFTNRSKPLLDFVESIFLGLKIKAKSNCEERVFVYNKAGIEKYINLIGSHNSNLIERFESHKSNRDF